MAAESRECCLSRAMGSSCRGGRKRERIRGVAGPDPCRWDPAPCPVELCSCVWGPELICSHPAKNTWRPHFRGLQGLCAGRIHPTTVLSVRLALRIARRPSPLPRTRLAWLGVCSMTAGRALTLLESRYLGGLVDLQAHPFGCFSRLALTGSCQDVFCHGRGQVGRCGSSLQAEQGKILSQG